MKCDPDVDLDTDTAIVMRFLETARGIELLRGEAVFDVGADPERPSVVRCGSVSARTVGTRIPGEAVGDGEPGHCSAVSPARLLPDNRRPAPLRCRMLSRGRNRSATFAAMSAWRLQSGRGRRDR
ncbi:FecR domain-containing protein [Methylobacterium haplocladii]|uniref:FecR domain-containing protein n=1 Tax=Methylobacterium haplocladii TaxID=1176176 RepID=UPI0024536FD2|nr:FecR domain-containing protein [Methylobacterium haplocladii]